MDEPLAATKFTLDRYAPATELRPFVEYYWVLHWDLRGQPPHLQRILPNLSVHASFFAGESGVFGPARQSRSHLLRGRVQGLGVRFRPGCFRPFLAAPVSTIADSVLPLRDIFGTEAERALSVVSKATEDDEMVTEMDRLLCTNVPTLPTSAERAAQIVETVAADSAITTVARLAEAAGTTVRTLQRLFGEYVGVGPKWAIRVYRINEAAQRIGGAERIDYAALADELGYSDQAHFTRDFTAAVGTPPARYGNR